MPPSLGKMGWGCSLSEAAGNWEWEGKENREGKRSKANFSSPYKTQLEDSPNSLDHACIWQGPVA